MSFDPVAEDLVEKRAARPERIAGPQMDRTAALEQVLQILARFFDRGQNFCVFR
jgi:hypothetical protein